MIADLACPHCGRINQVHDAGAGAAPKAGDVSLCWGCRHAAVFDVDDTGNATVRKPTDAEAVEIAADPDIRDARAAMLESYTPRQALQLRGRRSAP